MPPSPQHRYQTTATGIHTIVAFVYLDSTSRLSDSGFNAEFDVGKVAKQLSDKTYWILESAVPPIWAPLGGGGSSQDVLVKTSAADVTANYLGDKMLNTATIVWDVTDPGTSSNQQVYGMVQDGSSIQKLEVAKSGSLVGTHKQINFIEGANITLTVDDNTVDDRVDVTIEATGSGSSTDQYVRIDASDTTSGYLDAKLLVSTNGLVKTIQNSPGNETMTIALPGGTANNLLRYDGTAWVSDGRIINRGAAAASGNGAAEIIPNASDTVTASLYSSTHASSSNHAIYGASTIGLGVAGVSNQGTGVYAETTTGSGGRALLVKAKSSSANNAIEVEKDSATGLFMRFLSNVGTPTVLMDFPATGSLRMWAGGNSIELKPAATITSSHSLVLPGTQGSANTYLKNDGSGNLTWASGSSTPGGSTGQGQWNNAGSFAGSAGIVMDATNVTTLTVVGATNINNSGSAVTNIATSTTAGVTTIGNTSRVINTVGTLTHTGALTVVGTTNVNSTGTAATLIGNTTGGTTITGPTTQFGALLMKGSGGNSLTINTPAGIAAHSWTLPTAQGGVGSFLQNNGSGVLSWAPGTTNNPGGSNTQVQFNNGGVFGGSPNFTWIDGTPKLTIEAELNVNNTAGGKAIILGNSGTNMGGRITIPSSGASSLLIQTSSSSANAQGFTVVTGNGTGNGNGGIISLLTGIEAGSGRGGGIAIQTGGNVRSGDVNLSTGGASTGSSGEINIFTGASASYNTGGFLLATGESTGTVGNTGGFTIRTGSGGTTTGSSGGITLMTGSAYGAGLQSGGISLIAGDAGNSAAIGGGAILIQAGAGVGANAGGNVIIYPGGNGTGGSFGTLTLCGNTGHKLAFWDGIGGSKPAAYTQTYAATTRILTKANTANDIGNLPIGAAYNQAELQALRDKCEILASDLRILTNFVNSLTDDFQSYGLV